MKKICFKKPMPFDWLSLIVIFSFAFIVVSIISSDIEKFKEEMEFEARHLQAEILFMKQVRYNRD